MSTQQQSAREASPSSSGQTDRDAPQFTGQPAAAQRASIAQQTPEPQAIAGALTLLQAEVARVLGSVNTGQLAEAARLIQASPRIFLAGAGRSGLALRMVAMRLMHLGLVAHVAGDVTTPAIGAGDLLIVASASGTTGSMVQAAKTAQQAGARVLLVTTAQQAPLVESADALVLVPAASKGETGERSSQQYAGSLFEQAVLLVMDALFHAIWQAGTQTAQELLSRHANLE